MVLDLITNINRCKIMVIRGSTVDVYGDVDDLPDCILEDYENKDIDLYR
jgi:hypothetical protein